MKSEFVVNFFPLSYPCQLGWLGQPIRGLVSKILMLPKHLCLQNTCTWSGPKITFSNNVQTIEIEIQSGLRSSCLTFIVHSGLFLNQKSVDIVTKIFKHVEFFTLKKLSLLHLHTQAKTSKIYFFVWSLEFYVHTNHSAENNF